MTTKVEFRKFIDGGDIIAVFPECIWNTDYNITSYQHIGQHGGCSSDYRSFTKPASKEEYIDLYNELVSIGYDDLVIIIPVELRK